MSTTDAPSDKKPKRPLGPIIAFALPFLALPGAALYGSMTGLTGYAPTLPDPAKVDRPVYVSPVRGKRIYVPVRNDMVLTFPETKTVLTFTIGLAMDADGSSNAIKNFNDAAEPALAELTGLVQDMWSAMGEDRDLTELRAALPPVLREALNRRIVAIGWADRPVILEVLILEFNAV